MDDDAMTPLLFEGQGRAISAATATRSEASTAPSSPTSMDQAAMRTLPNANKVLAFLHSIFGLCQQVRDRPRASLQAHARLHQAFLRIASAAKHGSLPVGFRLSHFIVLLNQLKAVLDQHLKLPNLVAKVAASRRLLSGLARVHHELNVVLVDNSLASATSSLLEWKQQFASNRLQDEKTLHDTLMALLSTPTFVNKEFPSERRQALMLLGLVAEFASNDPPRGHSTQLVETLKMTHRRISNLCDLHLRRVPRWFLPGCEVDFSLTEHTIGHSRGSFGSTLHRGEAYRYNYNSEGALSSSTSTVAVKCLWALPDVQYQFVEQLFARSGVAKWTRVRHPNVVTVRGASHAATPPYLVRDFTTYGGLTSYLAALETRAKQCAGPESTGKMEALTWQLLYGASRGLLYLHEQHSIVHGGLRCNNILVDKKGRAVIADFGLYTLACDARDSGLTEYFQLDVFDADAEELIRWQAPECLREHVAYRESLRSLSETGSALLSSGSSASATSFATDVYAFGMCILEALTRTVPWAGLDIAKIRTLKGNLSLLPPRPKYISVQAWSLIEKMCAADPKQRITLSEASQELKRLGYGNRVFNRSQNSSSKDLEGLETDAVSKVDRVSSVLEEVSQKLQHLSNESRSRGSSTTDLKTMEADAAATVEHVFTSLSEASQDLKEISERSRNGSAADLGEIEEQASQKLVCVSSLLNIASQELKRLGMGDKASDSRSSSTQDLVVMAQEALAKLTRLSSEEVNAVSADESGSDLNSSADKEPTGSSTAEPFISAPSDRVEAVEEVTATDLSAPSEASTVEQTGRRVKDSMSARRQRYSCAVAWDAAPVNEEKVASIWMNEEESKATVPRSREVVRSLHVALGEDGSSTSTDDSAEASPAPEANSNHSAYDQPEQEMDSDTGSFKDAISDDDSAVLLSDDDVEGVTTGESCVEDDALMIVPAEFQTARSYDEATDPMLHPVIGLLESLRTEPDEALFVESLAAMKEDLELSTAWTLVEREGLLTLMELVWRNYSDACTLCALELLQLISTLNSDFVTILVESKVVKILLAVVKHRSSPQQVDFAASFLLEIIAENDDAKQQLWKCRGVAVMEDSLVIDRRLVQEVKSTMAKFKRSEGYKSLEDGEYHLAIDKFTEAIALDRKRAGYYGDRSLAYMEASMFKKATDDAYRCMRYNPYDVTGYLRHGLALKAMGKFKEAMASLRKGTKVDPKFTKIQDALADTEKLYKARLKGGDGTVLRRMTAAESAKLKKKDGDDALRKKDFTLAIECYSEALELDPKNDWVHLHRSIAHAARGDHTKAIEDASRCIRINYRQVEGYYRLALALHAAGQHDQALSTLYRGQEVDPRHAGITRFISQLEAEEAKEAGLPLTNWFKEKGYRAFQLRSYEDAIKFYTKAIDASQSDDDDVVMHCYLYRSRANQTRGEFSAVITDCTYVLERRPKNVFARLRRADAYEQQRDFHMALKDIRELVALNPDYEDAHARLRSLEHRCRLLPGASEHKAVEVDL
ncbi:Tetratricopeptide repeat [Phytophthora infestans]|uniref:Tetratricopeptide repeat n=1 Tax=Phytophthora infestans TaxID=4787 RepID=A0A833T3G5_PHYIN|nr:Tetratricopeptide repeat [Phytophthora infestans]KAF4132230.1 Tetratricopeptide repeat [Phytophthora infestans]KAF4145241.1 Tetratricopeptide repeat [Phytophthora infestans]